MQELIKMNQDENGNLLVSGRDLHEHLEVETPYHIWFPRMIEYGFVENVDFTSFEQKCTKPKGGRPSIDHAINLDMAKEISMIQRTDKGKEARQYFIQVEKKHRKQVQVPTSQRELAKLALLANEETNQRVDAIKMDIENLKIEITLTRSQKRKVISEVRSTVVKVLGGIKSAAYRNKSIRNTAFSNCYKQVHNFFDVSSYEEIPKIRFDEAISIIPRWHPTLELQSAIDHANGTGDIFE